MKKRVAVYLPLQQYNTRTQKVFHKSYVPSGHYATKRYKYKKSDFDSILRSESGKLIYIKNSSRRRSSHFGRGPNVRKDFQSIGNELKSNFSLFTHPFSQFGRGPNIKKDFQSIGNEIYNNYSAVRKL